MNIGSTGSGLFVERISGIGGIGRVAQNTGQDKDRQDIFTLQKEYEETLKKERDLKQEQEKQKREQAAQERKNQLEMLKSDLEASKEQSEAMEDRFQNYAKCLTIASRISKGDIVPPKDMKFLAENEPDLFRQAILMRVPNSDPKKHKSVLDDDDEEKDDIPGAENDGGESASPVSGSEAAVTETEAAAPEEQE